jgi:uncharacterized membrane protein YgdD (TMEM256/DUF423 family)
MWMIRFGAGACFFGVLLGAFAAHGLSNILGDSAIKAFKTGVNYVQFLGMSLIVVGLCETVFKIQLKRVGQSLVLGTFLFSGSIFLLTLTPVKGIALVTPLGGLIILYGWALFVFKSFKLNGG